MSSVSRSAAEPVSADAAGAAIHHGTVGAPVGLQGRRTFDAWMLSRILGRLGSVPIRFVLLDGAIVDPPAGEPIATVQFKTRRALAELAWNPELCFGENYTSGAIEVEGDF